MDLETSKRKSYFVKFTDVLQSDDNCYCEVTEWTNGEGIDVSYYDKIFSLTWAEAKILRDLINVIYD